MLSDARYRESAQRIAASMASAGGMPLLAQIIDEVGSSAPTAPENRR